MASDPNNGMDDATLGELPAGGGGIPSPNPPAAPPEIDKVQTAKEIAQFTIDIYKGALDELTKAVPEYALAKFDAEAFKLQAEIFTRATAPVEFMLSQVESMGVQTMAVADAMQRLTGLNALALSRDDFGVTNLGKKMAKAGFESLTEISKAGIVLADGTKVAAEYFGTADQFFKSYADAALNDSKLFVAATNGLNDDIIRSTRLSQRNLGATTTELNQIFNIELARTGQITGDFLKDFQKTAIATAQATSLPVELITDNLNRMLSDFTHFGNLTLPQMGSLTNTISKLGLEISDVTRLADKFSSFDSAAQAMSNLAATTGVTLDTLDLFEKAASGDMESFIESFREQLDAQGLEFENLNFMQQKQIAAGFGIDPRVLQKLLNDNFATIESATAEIEAQSSKLSDEETEKIIASMARLDALKPDELLERAEGFKAVSLEYAASIERGYLAVGKTASAGIDAITQGQSRFMKQLDERREALDEYVERLEALSKRKTDFERGASRPAPIGSLKSEEISVPAPAAGATPAAPATAAPASTTPAPAATAPASAPAAPAEPAGPAAGKPGPTVADEVAARAQQVDDVTKLLFRANTASREASNQANTAVLAQLNESIGVLAGAVEAFSKANGTPISINLQLGDAEVGVIGTRLVEGVVTPAGDFVRVERRTT